MIISTKGIVLTSFDYSETSIISKIYTRQLGLQSYIVKGVRKKGARLKRNLFSPLSLLSMVVSHKEGEGLKTLKEGSCYYQFSRLTTDISKISVSLYLSELLTRSISSAMHDPDLYDFIEDTIINLDSTKENISGLPLMFAIRLSEFHGLSPLNNYDKNHPYFDLAEGKFVNELPIHNHFIDIDLSKVFSEILHTIDSGIQYLLLPYKTRVELLEKLHEYYRLHIPQFGEIKSVQVLTDILRD